MDRRNEMILADLKAKYDQQASSLAFSRLYENDDEFGHMFSVLHKKLNGHFIDINGRAVTTHHYWADPSRELIALIEELNEDLYQLNRAGVEVTFSPEYQAALDRCEPWLSRAGGSIVPDDFEPIEIVKYDPVFVRDSDTIKVSTQEENLQLTMVGEGSYAVVYSYVDPTYGIQFAVKKAKRGIAARDLERFKQEFDVMKRLSFPYVVEVYRYDEERNQYSMEYCDETLRTFISKRNGILNFATRKRIALQFLYGMNYIHSEDLLHRDISLQNVLVKVFSSGAVLVKLSDFGLVKDPTLDFTRTTTEMRGTIRDPQLENFKDYNVPNEIYAIGWVLSFIFSGRESLSSGAGEWAAIIRKCVAHDVADRYPTVLDLIADVEGLAVTPTDAPA